MAEPSLRDEEELARIRSAYDAYATNGRAQRWSDSDPANRLIQEERNRTLALLLASIGPWDPGSVILDVGCGSGGSMADWVGMGADVDKVIGVDLLLDRLAGAMPELRTNIVCGGAHRLPFRDGAFDFVSLFTVLSSIISEEMRMMVAAEARRVLRPGGRIVCYDMRLPNPLNRDLRALTLRRLGHLFPGASGIESAELTLLPPLARKLVPSAAGYGRWVKLRFLRSHRLSLITFPENNVAV